MWLAHLPSHLIIKNKYFMPFCLTSEIIRPGQIIFNDGKRSWILSYRGFERFRYPPPPGIPFHICFSSIVANLSIAGNIIYILFVFCWCCHFFPLKSLNHYKLLVNQENPKFWHEIDNFKEWCEIKWWNLIQVKQIARVLYLIREWNEKWNL